VTDDTSERSYEASYASVVRRALARGALVGLLFAAVPVVVALFDRPPGHLGGLEGLRCMRFNPRHLTSASIMWQAPVGLTIEVATLLTFTLGLATAGVATLLELRATRRPLGGGLSLLAVASVAAILAYVQFPYTWRALGGEGLPRAVEGIGLWTGFKEATRPGYWPPTGPLDLARILSVAIAPVSLASLLRSRRLGLMRCVAFGVLGSGLVGVAFGLGSSGGLVRRLVVMAALGGLVPVVDALVDALDHCLRARLTAGRAPVDTLD
jgi:hypothetical protein